MQEIEVTRQTVNDLFQWSWAWRTCLSDRPQIQSQMLGCSCPASLIFTAYSPLMFYSFPLTFSYHLLPWTNWKLANASALMNTKIEVSIFNLCYIRKDNLIKECFDLEELCWLGGIRCNTILSFYFVVVKKKPRHLDWRLDLLRPCVTCCQGNRMCRELWPCLSLLLE